MKFKQKQEFLFEKSRCTKQRNSLRFKKINEKIKLNEDQMKIK